MLDDSLLHATLQSLMQQSRRVALTVSRPNKPFTGLTTRTFVGYVTSVDTNQITGETYLRTVFRRDCNPTYLLVAQPKMKDLWALRIERITAVRKGRDGTYPVLYERSTVCLTDDGDLDVMRMVRGFLGSAA